MPLSHMLVLVLGANSLGNIWFHIDYGNGFQLKMH